VRLHPVEQQVEEVRRVVRPEQRLPDLRDPAEDRGVPVRPPPLAPLVDHELAVGLEQEVLVGEFGVVERVEFSEGGRGLVRSPGLQLPGVQGEEQPVPEDRGGEQQEGDGGEQQPDEAATHHQDLSPRSPACARRG
jgi:hypothetical protein